MNIKVPAGKYVLAVSGGVDSMALLDLLSKTPGVELIIAHFNHGIRPDSDEDEKLTAKAAAAYGDAGYRAARAVSYGQQSGCITAATKIFKKRNHRIRQSQQA
jgi:tRNA(Ile)-lysidine synthase TilS/MesJ